MGGVSREPQTTAVERLKYNCDRFALSHGAQIRWRRVLLADPCAYCGERADAVDHIAPRIRGGRNDWRNYAPSCGPCNSMKGKGSLAWMIWRSHELRNGRALLRPVSHRVVNGERIVTGWMWVYQGHHRMTREGGTKDTDLLRERA